MICDKVQTPDIVPRFVYSRLFLKREYFKLNITPSDYCLLKKFILYVISYHLSLFIFSLFSFRPFLYLVHVFQLDIYFSDSIHGFLCITG